MGVPERSSDKKENESNCRQHKLKKVEDPDGAVP